MEELGISRLRRMTLAIADGDSDEPSAAGDTLRGRMERRTGMEGDISLPESLPSSLEPCSKSWRSSLMLPRRCTPSSASSWLSSRRP